MTDALLTETSEQGDQFCGSWRKTEAVSNSRSRG